MKTFQPIIEALIHCAYFKFDKYIQEALLEIRYDERKLLKTIYNLTQSCETSMRNEKEHELVTSPFLG